MFSHLHYIFWDGIYVVQYINISFFIFKWYFIYFIVQIWHNLSIHLTVDGHLGCFLPLPSTNKVSVNTCVQVVLWPYGFTPIQQMYKSRIAELYNNCILNYESAKCFCKVIVPVRIHTSIAEEFKFLHILSKTWYDFFLI